MVPHHARHRAWTERRFIVSGAHDGVLLSAIWSGVPGGV